LVPMPGALAQGIDTSSIYNTSGDRLAHQYY